MPDAPKINNLEDLQKVLNEMAANLKKYVQDEMRDRHWTSAFIDERGSASGTIYKLRVKLPDGTLDSTLDMPMSVNRLSFYIWQVKDKLLNPSWHGLKMSVYSDGKCEVEYNYDPNCMNDKTFFDE